LISQNVPLGLAQLSRYSGFNTEIRSMFRNRPAASPSSRTRSITTLCAAAFALVAAAALWQPHSVAAQAAPAPNSPEFYTQRVQPILQANCYRCHGGLNHRGGLSLATKAGMLRGGHDGTVIIPGDAQTSLLVRLIRHEGPANDPMPMPPKAKISDADIATVTQWVQAGAITPPDQTPQ
jgi:cytochrome c